MDKDLPQYHLLPKGDPDRVVDILRRAAGLPPLEPGGGADESPV